MSKVVLIFALLGLITGRRTTWKPYWNIADEFIDHCIIPKAPKSGQWFVSYKGLRTSRLAESDTLVALNTTLKLQCPSDTFLRGQSSIKCVKPNNYEAAFWTPSGYCSSISFCPILKNTTTTFVSCTYLGKKHSCKKASNGVEAFFSCSSSYLTIDIEKTIVCSDGSWGNKIPECRFKRSTTSTSTSTSTTTTTTTTTTEHPHLPKSCILPKHPKNGQWSLNDPTKSPGMSVPSQTTLKLKCAENSHLDGQSVIFCENGSWSSTIGHCIKTCPPRISTSTVKVTCIYKTKITENCTKAIDGTLARFKCVPFYEDFALKRRSVHLCRDGEWSQLKPRCEAICGRKRAVAAKLIINGDDVIRGEFPWQVAIYKKNDKKLICGGTILNRKIVLTAAHCVSDDKGNVYPKEDYIIVAGKYYRNFNDSRDFNESQFSELSAIFIHEDYKGHIHNYRGDIAILISKEVFTITRSVQPVCINAEEYFEYALPKYGYVTGWGYTAENSNPSEVLKNLKVPFVSITECEDNLPEEDEIYLTTEKLCAGYLNKSMSVCKGDSGGGLVVKRRGRYYITGIVSIAPVSPTGGCNSQLYTLYTRVSNYMNYFILPKLATYN